MKFPRYHTTSPYTRLFIRRINPIPEHKLHKLKLAETLQLQPNLVQTEQKISFQNAWRDKLTRTYNGPSFNLLRTPSLTSASTPTPLIAEFSSLAIKTATTVDFKLGLVSPSLFMSSETSATCPKQSVVPRPRSLSPSMLSVNGSKSYINNCVTITCTNGKNDEKE